MPDLLTLQHFEPLLHHRFEVRVDENASFQVELVEVQTLPKHGAARDPFSLIFRGPRDFYVPQRIYTLQHETLGNQDVFLVPIGPDDVGHRYQAIFQLNSTLPVGQALLPVRQTRVSAPLEFKEPRTK